ncbi:MAG: hypothetical protein ABIP61_08200, partial [Burkholderiaceae bacterium]
MQLNPIKSPSPISNVAPPTGAEGLSDTARNEARFANLLRQNQATAAQAQAVPPAPHKEPAPRSGHDGAQAQSGARPHADPAPPQAPPPTPGSAAARERDTPAPRAS